MEKSGNGLVLAGGVVLHFDEARTMGGGLALWIRQPFRNGSTVRVKRRAFATHGDDGAPGA